MIRKFKFEAEIYESSSDWPASISICAEPLPTSFRRGYGTSVRVRSQRRTVGKNEVSGHAGFQGKLHKTPAFLRAHPSILNGKLDDQFPDAVAHFARLSKHFAFRSRCGSV
jgi:hypothetical protein